MKTTLYKKDLKQSTKTLLKRDFAPVAPYIYRVIHCVLPEHIQSWVDFFNGLGFGRVASIPRGLKHCIKIVDPLCWHLERLGLIRES